MHKVYGRSMIMHMLLGHNLILSDGSTFHNQKGCSSTVPLIKSILTGLYFCGLRIYSFFIETPDYG